MAFTGALEDRIHIRELVDTYNDAVNRKDTEAWTSTWAEDSVWDLMGTEFIGRETIVQAWKGAMAGFSYVGFTAFQGAMDIDGNKAEARFYVRETLIQLDGKKLDIQGLYQDELRKIDGAWKFSKRVYSILHQTTTEPEPTS